MFVSSDYNLQCLLKLFLSPTQWNPKTTSTVFTTVNWNPTAMSDTENVSHKCGMNGGVFHLSTGLTCLIISSYPLLPLHSSPSVRKLLLCDNPLCISWLFSSIWATISTFALLFHCLLLSLFCPHYWQYTFVFSYKRQSVTCSPDMSQSRKPGLTKYFSFLQGRMLETEPRDSHLRGMCFATELYPEPFLKFYFEIWSQYFLISFWEGFAKVPRLDLNLQSSCLVLISSWNYRHAAAHPV